MKYRLPLLLSCLLGSGIRGQGSPPNRVLELDGNVSFVDLPAGIFDELPAAAVNALIDPVVMVQVLENLMSNAVESSPPGKNIGVGLNQASDGVRGAC